MYFHIILSETCDSRCRYCYGKSMKEFDNGLGEKFEFDFSAPVFSKVKIDDLKKFLKKDNDPRIIFYGGEPLMNIKKIKEIMDNIDAKFYIQTNGKLLNKLEKEYINRFQKMLISIDGDGERTDFNRGQGTYEIVKRNINLIKHNGYSGELIARMTISFSDGFTDLLKQIKHLFSIGFDSIHWQLDMGFYKFDFDGKSVSNFISEYNKEVSKIINYWVENMKKGNVLKIYPFLGIMDSLLKNEKTLLRCGSGYANYTITTNGKLTVCPIMNNIVDFYVGDIKNSNPGELKKIFISNKCSSCEYSNLCGGRCLYSNYAKLWPEKGQDLICLSIKHLIEELKSKLDEIRNLIKEGIIDKNKFEYEKYFGPEIIP